MKTIRTSSQVREGLNNKSFSESNGLTAVIVTIPFSSKKQDLGVQFWSDSDLSNGFVINTDSTVSRFVDIY
jgi:hypothetical protein